MATNIKALTSNTYLTSTTYYPTSQLIVAGSYTPTYTLSFPTTYNDAAEHIESPNTVPADEWENSGYDYSRIRDMTYKYEVGFSSKKTATAFSTYDAWIVDKTQIRVGDYVDTPKGRGKVYIIDEDVYCVELDPTSDILHEFTLDEIVKNGL
jgi:hypothetical protein